AETHFLAAQAARRNGDLAEALRLLEQAEKLGWVQEAIELERALVSVPLGELPEVEKYLSSCIAQDHPNTDLIVEVLAPPHLRNYNPAEADRYARIWTDVRPDSPAAWACRGVVGERLRDINGALAAYRRAVE